MAHENDGHRTRLRERMMREGASGFQDHEVLELLLFGSVARKDTNKLAHNLLSKFGGFSAVLNASPEQLMTVKGVSTVTACNIAILKEVFHRYKKDEQDKSQLKGLASIIRYVQTTISDSFYERMVVVYVDGATTFMQLAYASFLASYFAFRHWKVSSLMSCSRRQASALAFSSLTPIHNRISVSSSWRS